MREKLQQLAGKRATFRATFRRFGRKTKQVPGPHGWYSKEFITVLLVDITDTRGNEICDHLWFNLTKGFARVGLIEGEKVQFDARANEYWKGYMGDREEFSGQEKDYCLRFPTNIRRVVQYSQSDLPLFKQ